MEGFGERVRKRARELGLSDAELGRRAGVEPSKFGKYIRNLHEPDFQALLQICRVLDTTPNDLLLAAPSAVPSEREILLSRIVGSCESLPDVELRVVARMVACAGAPTKAS